MGLLKQGLEPCWILLYRFKDAQYSGWLHVKLCSMKKSLSLHELTEQLKKHRNIGETVALITGCFDVIHIGHIKLFRFAKSKANIVVVGLDSDVSIRASKGKERPINDLKTRITTLSELTSIDYIFGINTDFDFKSNKQGEILDQIALKLLPDFLVTNPTSDLYWKEKQKRARKSGAKLLFARHKKKYTSSEIISKIIQSEL